MTVPDFDKQPTPHPFSEDFANHSAKLPPNQQAFPNQTNSPNQHNAPQFGSNQFGGTQPGTGSKSSNQVRNTLLVVFGVVGFSFLFICGGIGTLAYFLIEKANQRTVAEPIPARPPFSNEMREFDQSLASAQQPKTLTAAEQAKIDSLEKFIADAITAINSGGLPPHDSNGFFAAIEQSPEQPNLNAFERLSVNAELQSQFPPPDVNQQFRLLAAHQDPQTKTWVADILFYSASDFAISSRWYLYETPLGWKLYDHARIEFSRRASDEWALYIRYSRNRKLADGMSDALALCSEAENFAFAEPPDMQRAERLLQKAEATPTLPGDRFETRLRIAWTAQALGLNDHARRLLNDLYRSTASLAAGASLSYDLQLKGELDQQLQLAKRLADAHPHHPNAMRAYANALQAADRNGEAVDLWLKIHQILPDDTSILWNLLYQVDEVQAAQLIQQQLDYSTDRTPIFTLLKTSSERDFDHSRLLAELQQRGCELSSQLQAYLQVASDLRANNAEQAITALTALKGQTEDTEIAQQAAGWLQQIWQSTDDYRSLFANAEDLTVTLHGLLQEIVYDEFYGNSTALLAAVEDSERNVASHPFAALISAILSPHPEPEQQLSNLRRFLDWAEAEPEDFTRLDDEYLIEDAQQRWIMAMTNQGRYAEVLSALPANPSVVEFYVTALLRRGDLPAINALRDAEPIQSLGSSQAINLLVQAYRDHLADDFAAADDYLVKAITAYESFNGDTDWRYAGHLGNEMIDLRAHWLIDRQSMPDPNDFQTGSPQTAALLFEKLCDDADTYLNSSLLDWCKRAKDRFLEHADPATQQRCEQQLLSSAYYLAISTSKWAEAADASLQLLEQVSTNEDPSNYIRWIHAQRAVSALCRAGRMPEAYQVASEHDAKADPQSQRIPLLANVLLADGLYDRLLEVLAPFNPTTVSTWLSSSDARNKLVSDPKLIDTLSQHYSYALRDLYHARYLRIGTVATEPPNEQTVIAAVQSVLGASARVQQYPATSEASESSRSTVYYVQDDTGNNYLVAIASARPAINEALPAALYEQVQQCPLVITVSSPQWSFESTIPVWKLANALIDHDSRFVVAPFCSRVWYGDDLSNRLQWNEQIPISQPSTVIDSDLFVDTNAPMDTTAVKQTGDELRKRLEQESTVPCTIQIAVADVMVAVQAEALSINEDSTVQVRLQEDYPLETFLKQGHTVSADIQQVRL